MDETIIFEGRMSWRSFYHLFIALAFSLFTGLFAYYPIVNMVRVWNRAGENLLVEMCVLSFFLVAAIISSYVPIFYIRNILKGRVDRQIFFRGGLHLSYTTQVYKIRWSDVGELIAWKSPFSSGYYLFLQINKWQLGSTGGANMPNPCFRLDCNLSHDQVVDLFQKVREQAISPPICRFHRNKLIYFASRLMRRIYDW